MIFFNSRSFIWLLLLGGFLLILWLETQKPKAIDWTVTLDSEDKNPYGTFVLYKQLKDLFPHKVIIPTQKSIYETLSSVKNSNFQYVIICKKLNISQVDTKILLKRVEEGAMVFISAEYFEGPLKDSLKLEIENAKFFNEQSILNFVHPDLKTNSGFKFEKNTAGYSFKRFDTLNTKVLAVNDLDHPVLLRIQQGQGSFIISSTPIAFTNYNVLHPENISFVTNSFSYFPVRDIYWDNYQTSGQAGSKSPFRVLLQHPPLTWALYLSIVTALLYVVIAGKRRQRVIPIITPLKNTSMEFAETIGLLYYNQSNHLNLANKKIQ